MRHLTILYDANCQLCCRIRAWLMEQPSYLELRFVPANSDGARRAFPGLDHAKTLQELTVIADGGAVYYGAKGWLMCLWALREYREWSFKLARPDLMPTARRFIAWISRNRRQFGRIGEFFRGETPLWRT